MEIAFLKNDLKRGWSQFSTSDILILLTCAMVSHSEEWKALEYMAKVIFFFYVYLSPLSVCMHVNVCVSVHVPMCVGMRVHIHACVHMCLCVCMCMHMLID